MKNNEKLSLAVFFLLGLINSIGLFLYSYTQVDLNLTLSRASIWQTIQKGFQSIGFFNRPLSLNIYIGLLLFLFMWYGYTVFLVMKQKIHAKTIWQMILCMTGILVFAYPAFSYDLFNHMFTAKTILLYGKNPYAVTPLQFAGFESWLTFMRWTHVVSIYSPLWIGLTLIPYIFGFGYFLLILWNFKLLIALFYLMTAYVIGKILQDEKNNLALLGVVLFAFNPLVIIESLVSAHNDIVMMAFGVFALYLLRKKELVHSFFIYSISIASKLMTISMFPIYIFPKVKWIPIVSMSAGLILFLFITKREIMPWYALWFLPFAALYPQKHWITILCTGISLGLLLRYAPFLYLGNWDDPVPMIKIWVTTIPIIVSLGIVLITKFSLRRK
jgi:hypothetical protein